MADKNFMNKSFILKRGAMQTDGTHIIDGAIELFLKAPYGKSDILSVNTIAGKNGEVSVCNCEGSVKVDDRINKQLSYFFGVDFPIGSYVDVKVGVWGTWGKALAKFNVSEGDLFMFFLSSIKCESFQRKNGETGYALRANAFDFKPIRTTKKGATQSDAPVAPAAPAKASAPTSVVNPVIADFDEFDDDGDLPF